MSAFTNFAIITARIIIALLQELAIARAIIVERNLHAYYKLPIKPAQYMSIPQEYHILQCPYQNTTAIPTPEKMEICVVINTYRQEVKNSTTILTTKSPLHTKVKYQMPRKHRNADTQLTKRPKARPYLIVIRPVRMDTESNCRYAKILPLKPSSYLAEHLGIVKKDNSRILEQKSDLQSMKPPDQRTASTNIVAKIAPIMENVEENAESVDEKVMDRSSTNSTAKTSVESEEDGEDDGKEHADYDGNSEKSKKESILAPKTSVLKYLGTKDAIKNLSRHHARDRTLPVEGSERYFAEHKDLQRGEKVHGFQNYYHRDEIFNDHVFYDDVQQQGEYSNRGRA